MACDAKYVGTLIHLRGVLYDYERCVARRVCACMNMCVECGCCSMCTSWCKRVYGLLREVCRYVNTVTSRVCA